jgi:hypothetical protein
MDFTLRLVFCILAVNAAIVFMALVFYLTVGRRKRITVDFEEYLSSLPRDARICDPYILVDGKWVKSNPDDPNSSANP